MEFGKITWNFLFVFFEKGVFGNGKEEARMKDRK
jgi:hypothetical protein